MSRRKSTKKIRGVFEKVPGSDIWWIQYFDADGRRRREKAGSRGNAIDLLTKRRNEVLVGKKLPEKLRARQVTLREIAKAALEYSLAEKASYRQDKIRMAPILERFGARAAESIKPEELEHWLNDEAEERDWAPATKNRYVALLKLTYRLAEKNGKVRFNPARLLRMHKENNARLRFLNQFPPLKTKFDYLQECSDEESRLRAVIARNYPEHLPEFEIALNSGMRPSEQYGLTWDRVDLTRKILTIPKSKNGRTRHIPLNSVAVTAFKTVRQRLLDGGEAVFVNMKGGPLQGYKHWFEPAVSEAGIKDFTWYCLRHTFASRLVMAGVDLRTVAELMGHQQIQMTIRYAHLAPAHTLAAVERLVGDVHQAQPAGEAEAAQETRSATISATTPKEGIGTDAAIQK
jgi:site-specific recombinase XerD